MTEKIIESLKKSNKITGDFGKIITKVMLNVEF